MNKSNNIYTFSCRGPDGEEKSLSTYEGKVLLIVNTASKCGFTPQYEDLENLYKKYSSLGFEVLGFPCNQFGSQEPGSDKEIKEFCSKNYNITFPVFSKIDVKGSGAHPLYKYLTSKKPGLMGFESIKWNFTKFLINKSGEAVKRFAPNTKPESISTDIKELLN